MTETISEPEVTYSCHTTGNLVRGSTLYAEFIAEREEILRHKWLESEKAGRDIGFEAALVSWVVHHRTAWRRGRYAPQNEARFHNSQLDSERVESPIQR